MKKIRDEDIQREYYEKTSSLYDSQHVNSDDEHYFSLAFLVATIDYYNIKTILDIGSGTGRVIAYMKEVKPNVKVVGLEPVKGLREEGYKKGILEDELIDGDATKLKYSDGEFDLVCEFGVLHHIRKPQLAVEEMLRVARKAIFISDSNNFGQGGVISRTTKQMINGVGLWGLANFIKTKGKGYTLSDGDGLAYSYSVFNNYNQIRKKCNKIHFINCLDSGWNLYRSASHVALLALKNDSSK